MKTLDEIMRMEISAKRTKIQTIESEIMKLKRQLNNSKLINRLPFEVMRLILGQLEPKQLFVCAKVCQKWSEYLSAVSLPKLIIAKKEDRKPRRWFFSDEQCDWRSTIIRPTLNAALLASENSLFVNLKQLKIINPNENQRNIMLTDFNLINSLSRLEVLEITEISFAKFEEVACERVGNPVEDQNDQNDQNDKKSPAIPTITLPNLKQLAIAHLNCEIKLNTPHLSSYRSQRLINATFVFPEQMTHLYFDYIYDQEIIRKFVNLQYLFVNHVICDYLAEGRPIGNHPNLTELSIGPALLDDNDQIIRLVSVLRQLMTERWNSGRDALRIVCRGVLVESMDQLEDDPEEDVGLLDKWFWTNHGQLCQKELRWIQEIDYCLLEAVSGYVGDWIFKECPLKFDRVSRVVIDGYVIDEGRMHEFLADFGERLSSLTCRTSDVSAQFFTDYLNSTCPALYSLTLHCLEDEDFFDLDFLLGFKNLYRLDTNLQLLRDDGESRSEEILYKLYEQLHTFHFTFDHKARDSTKRVSIKKEDRHSKFELYYGSYLFAKYDHLSSVIREIKN